MKRKLAFIGALGAVALAAAIAVEADAPAQSPAGLTPLYAGIDSQGARPTPQLPAPVMYFESKVYWPNLGIDEPRTAWEYAQRGIHRQDELEDLTGAIADYRRAEELDAKVLIAQARLANLELEEGARLAREGDAPGALTSFDAAITHLDHVIEETPHRLNLHFKLGEAFRRRYALTSSAPDADSAITAYRAELSESPNSQRASYSLAFLLADLGRTAEARAAIEVYLTAAERHGDTYPHRILAARRLLDRL